MGEIVNVLLVCVEHEERYNPFYSFLAHRLCSSMHQFKLTFQFAYWDRLKSICDASGSYGGGKAASSRRGATRVRQLSNLARVMAYLIVQFSLSLAILKVVE